MDTGIRRGAAVDKLAGLRRQIQLAADHAWPGRTPLVYVFDQSQSVITYVTKCLDRGLACETITFGLKHSDPTLLVASVSPGRVNLDARKLELTPVHPRRNMPSLNASD